MSTWSDNAKDEALEGVLNLSGAYIQLHDGDPGSDGTSNVIAGSAKSVTFATATGGQKPLEATETFSGLDPEQAVPWSSTWDGDPGDGGSYVAKVEHTGEGVDDQANASGEINLTSDYSLDLNNPS